MRKTRMSLALLPAALATLVTLVAPQALLADHVPREWHELIWPTRRSSASAIVDPVQNRLILFGGFPGGSSGLGDVWELPVTGTPEWRRLSPSGAAPSAREGHSAIYDPIRNRMILFGGSTGGNEVWSLSLTAPLAWTRILPAGPAPLPRQLHSAVYDSQADRMLIYAGYDPAGGTFGDVWALTLSGTPTWSVLSPAGTPPEARTAATAIYDPIRRSMIVFGGLARGWSNETWELTLGSSPQWFARATNGMVPTPRTGAAAVYDGTGTRMILFGGYGGTFLNDTYSLSLSGNWTWTQYSFGEARPPGRAYMAVAFDPARRRMLHFGGASGSARFNDTWELTLAAPMAWRQVAPFGPFPDARQQHTLSYDSARDRFLVFGGYGSSLTAFNDVHMLWFPGDPGFPGWLRLAPMGTPPSPRWGHAAVFDPIRERTIVFGGHDDLDKNDVWELTGYLPAAWNQLSPLGTPPSERRFPAGAWDARRDQALFYGGANSSNSNLAELWSLELAGTPRWTQILPTGIAPVPTRWGGMTYDPLRDRMLLVVSTGFGFDVWSIQLSDPPAWTRLVPSGTPPAGRNFPRVSYDPIRDALVLYGGDVTDAFQDGPWILTLGTTPVWTRLTTTGTTPSLGAGVAAAYDPRRDRMLMFGGQWGALFRDQLWELKRSEPARPEAMSGPGVTWTPGGPNVAPFTISNPLAQPRAVSWKLKGSRIWPSLPSHGVVVVPGLGSTPVVAVVDVPDTAAVGSFLLDVSAAFTGGEGYESHTEQMVDVAAPTDAMMSLVSVTASESSVQLVLQSSLSRTGPFVLQRRSGSIEWQTIQVAAPDGTGRVEFRDLEVRAGDTVRYRVLAEVSAGDPPLLEFDVHIPSGPALALEPVSPNPVVEEPLLSFQLPDGGTAQLELFDLAGRRVFSREVGGLGAGRHSLRVLPGGSRSAGVYMVVLSRGSSRLSTRFVRLN